MPHDAVGQEVNVGDLIVTQQKSRYILMLATTILPVTSANIYEPCIDTSYITIRVDYGGQVRGGMPAAVNLRHLKLSPASFIKVPNHVIATSSPVLNPHWASLNPDGLVLATDMYRRAFELTLMNIGNPKFKIPKDFR